ncbi:L-arabinose transport system permease protein AraQ [Planctomycetes bacterium Pla163]|jgi:multiple sugar transport system permease protein|uniref:L-arabinose transport system permease protein AraQ n=1 Tax=Rohdeia mirabilis TaxID=2528008 RepID=A0A518D1R3_9BACT|nr:L-arabinose transport system permease protein AraQ [Planctomycetes bacterium Pla163]
MSARTRPVRAAVTYTLLVACACAWAAPFVWMLSTSIKPESQALDPGVGLLPNLGGTGFFGSLRALADQIAVNYGGVLESESADFPTYYRNSIVVALASASLMTISSAFVAYGFARVRWPGREVAFAVVLGTMMVPFTVVMAPQYLLFKELGLIGTLLPLWLPSAFAGAFSVFLLRQFFMGLPPELDEAARIDGCGHFGIFWRVVLPNSTPALAAVFLLQFVAAWNDFVGPLVFLNHQEQYTLALGLQMYQSSHGGTPWSLLMAACVLTILPVLLVFALFQRAFTESVATRGLKG